MKSPNRTSVFTSKRTRRILLGFLFLVFLLVSIWRWKLISSSILSLVLTPVALVFIDAGSTPYLRSDLWEYWIAACVWLLTMIIFATRYARALFVGRHSVILPPASSDPRYFVGSRSTGKLILALFAYVALTAPILAPFHPTSQGDLTSTRLLRPFEKGVIIQAALPPNGRETLSPPSSMVVRLLDRANDVLLNREERFTRWDASATFATPVVPDQIKTFFLGTDDLGRDVFSRVIYGTRIFSWHRLCCNVLHYHDRLPHRISRRSTWRLD